MRGDIKNELAFLETPYVCLFSDLHKNLHKNRENLFRAMSLINEKYYSGDIFDGRHCDVIYTPDTSDEKLFKITRFKNPDFGLYL